MAKTVEDDDVRAAQLSWYASHTPWVAAGLRRHADRMALLALEVSDGGVTQPVAYRSRMWVRAEWPRSRNVPGASAMSGTTLQRTP